MDRARELAKGLEGELALADMGTGSGCLAVTLALELSAARVWGTDISEEAVEVARENAELLEAEVDFRVADGAGGLREVVAEFGAPMDLIVSNPPYVEPGEAESLAPEVREYEPDSALFCPEGDPDHWVRALLESGRELLSENGVILVELGHMQGPRVMALAQELGWTATLHKDLDGISRVLEASCPEA